MANKDKKGKSEKKTSFWGKEYIQHYDSKGNKSGRSERKETFFGKKYTQHYDAKGEKRGRSEKKETWTGKEYTQKYNTRGEKSGKSEKKETFFGNKYTQHYDQQGNKTDWSEKKETFFGRIYRQRYGDEKPRGASSTTKTRTSYGSPSQSSTDSSSLRPTALFGFIIGGALLVGLISLLGSAGTTKISPPPADTLGNAYVNTLQLNVRRGPGTEYGVITQLSKGTMVACLERSQSSQKWIKVRFDSSEGWVNEDYLSQSSPTTEETPAAAKPATASSEEPQAETRPGVLPEQQVNPEAEPLPPPQQLSPEHGVVMNHYPRNTTVEWERVAGAKTYTVEIQFLSGTVWSDLTEFHNSYPASGYVPPVKLVENKFSFVWVGANSGRWRVWAVDANGKDGYKSEWRQFHYSR